MKAVVEWRYVWIATGVQCVTMAGTSLMPPQCADNWDTTMQLVHQRGQFQQEEHTLAREVDPFTCQGFYAVQTM